MWSPVPSKWEPLCRVCCLSAHCHCIILVHVSGFLSLLADFHLIEVGSPVNDIWCSCELEWKNKKGGKKKKNTWGFMMKKTFISYPWSNRLHWQTLDAGPPTVIVLKMGPRSSHCVTGRDESKGLKRVVLSRDGISTLIQSLNMRSVLWPNHKTGHRHVSRHAPSVFVCVHHKQGWFQRGLKTRNS